jgi:hypothetical protein
MFGQIQKYLIYHYLVLSYLINNKCFFEYSEYLVSQSNVKTEGKIKFIAVTKDGASSWEPYANTKSSYW